MTERVLEGLAVSGGIAIGRALVVRDPTPTSAEHGGEAEATRALDALARVANDLGRAVERLRRAGRDEEAEIVEANQLMAEDPSLASDVRTLAAELPAESALLEATERHAGLLAGLSDPMLAARASDVRQLGRRAARLLAGLPAFIAPSRASILIARDLGPADVAELELGEAGVRGIALAEGAATSHAAIMARALGVPMVAGLGELVLETLPKEQVVLDGDRGAAIIDPGESTLGEGRAAVRRAQQLRRRRLAARDLPPETRDGQRIALLSNASTVAEVAAGLNAGAEGVGLLRTELAFLAARGWPDEREHTAALAPLLGLLADRIATVRTLDFGEDKTPPFLAGETRRGLDLALAQPAAFAAQLRAILRTGSPTHLRILLPLVRDAEQLRTARTILHQCLVETDWSAAPPPLGAMIETPEAAERAQEIAREADFLSIGTNDLVQYTLGLNRQLPVASTRAAADPRVLELVARVIEAARRENLTVEVCGEAAGEPPLAVLLVGLGVGELSVAPARVDDVRATVRKISAGDAAECARTALGGGSAEHALSLANELLSA